MDDKAGLFDKFLDFLNDIGALSEVVIVGSWDEFLYSEASVLSGFEHTIKAQQKGTPSS